MSISEMQACLARLYIDDAFRTLFYTEPEYTLRDYLLTASETTALRSIDRKMLDFFAGSLKNKRKDRLERAYPLLFRVAPAIVDRLYRRYYDLHPAGSHWPAYQDILDFGLFMEESLSGAGDAPPYARDVVRYERLSYLTNFGPAGMNGFLAPVDASAPVQMDDRPMQSKGLRVESFSYDIPSLEQMLAGVPANGNEPAIDACDCYLVFRPAAGDDKSKVLRVNSATKELLNLCDGRRTVTQIISEMESRFGATCLRESLMAAINRLLSAGAIEIVRG